MLGRSLLLKEGPFVFLAVVCHISFLEYSLNPFPQFGSEVDNSFGKPVNDKAQHQNTYSCQHCLSVYFLNYFLVAFHKVHNQPVVFS